MKHCLQSFASWQLALFAFLLAATVNGQPAKKDSQSPRRFELDDLGKLVGLSDPQISPDGKSIALIVSRPNYESNHHTTELVLVDTAGGRHRVLTQERQGVG